MRVLVGGNVGIGYETIKVRSDLITASEASTRCTPLTATIHWQALLQHNATVYMASRSKDKAEKAIASLKEATGKEALFHELDLSSLASVKKSAEEFLTKEHELHILYNNACVPQSFSLPRAL